MTARVSAPLPDSMVLFWDLSNRRCSPNSNDSPGEREFPSDAAVSIAANAGKRASPIAQGISRGGTTIAGQSTITSQAVGVYRRS